MIGESGVTGSKAVGSWCHRRILGLAVRAGGPAGGSEKRKAVPWRRFRRLLWLPEECALERSEVEAGRPVQTLKQGPRCGMGCRRG